VAKVGKITGFELGFSVGFEVGSVRGSVVCSGDGLSVLKDCSTAAVDTDEGSN